MNRPTGRIVLDHGELAAILHAEKRNGRTVAFANGCFDLLHVGHVRYLLEAAAVADVLCVAVNGDESVRSLKGAGRPYAPQLERAEVVAAIRGVDFVTIFSEASPRELLRRIQPDFQCKGTDYTAENVPEGDLVRSWGGKVVIVGDPKDHSSTALLGKIQASNP